MPGAYACAAYSAKLSLGCRIDSRESESLDGWQTRPLLGRIYDGSYRSNHDSGLFQINGMSAGNQDLPAVG